MYLSEYMQNGENMYIKVNMRSCNDDWKWRIVHMDKTRVTVQYSVMR